MQKITQIIIVNLDGIVVSKATLFNIENEGLNATSIYKAYRKEFPNCFVNMISESGNFYFANPLNLDRDA